MYCVTVPVTPRDDYHSVLENGLPTDMEMVGDQDRLLGLVRQALDTSPDAKSKERELILEHVIEVCGRQNDRTRLLLQNRKLLNMVRYQTKKIYKICLWNDNREK